MFFYTQADQTTTNTSGIDIPGFAIPLNIGGENWEFEFVLTIGSSSTAGVKVALTVPPGAVFRAWAVGSGAAKSTLQVDLMNSSGVLGAAFNTFAGTGNYLSIKGGIVNGTFAGSLQLQAAKVTSGTATLSAGSYLIAKVVD
jgi:hypothetical protein